MKKTYHFKLPARGVRMCIRTAEGNAARRG